MARNTKFVDDLNVVVDDLLEQFGENLYKIDDPDNPIDCYVADYNADQIDHENILLGDIRVTIASTDLEANAFFKLDSPDGGEAQQTWRVISVANSRAAGQTIIRVLQARKVYDDSLDNQVVDDTRRF